MKIALGADHAGYELKEKIKQHLAASGVSVDDQGTGSNASVDYPDFARKVAENVAARRADRGILVCGSGIGMAIAANKVPGVRAANVTSEYEAQMSREHNDVNVLALGARIVDTQKALSIVDKWLQSSFAGGRHQQRVDKIGALVVSQSGTVPFQAFSVAKREIDQLSGVVGWRLHDLRRTCVSGMARLGIAPHVADKVLNHQGGTISGVAAVYQRHDFLAERKKALEMWSTHVQRAVGRAANNYLPKVA